MIVLIPNRNTDILDARVIKSITAQNIPVQIGIIENTPVSGMKRKGEFEGRDKIVEICRGIKDDYVVTNDSDTQHLYVDNLDFMRGYLDLHKNIGMVSLWWLDAPRDTRPNQKDHVKLGCAMWRTSILAQMPILSGPESNYDVCCCFTYKKAIEALGFGAGYLDDLKRIKDLNFGG